MTTAVTAVLAGEIYKSVDANGNVVYSDHLDSTLSQTTVVQVEESSPLPRELHFCWTNCFTLMLDKGVYRRTDGTDENWTVETFSPEAIVLHRHDAPADWNGHSADVVYAGKVAYDRLIDVTVNGKHQSGIDASWGTALNTLPGSNAERDATNIADSGSASAPVSSTTSPPPLPEEDQPPLIEDGLLWTPGYWYWRDRGYFWVRGAWMRPPQVGYLWTPAYWNVAGSVFIFHPGHWGSTVGFYGGVNYGHGYFGNGYTGGHWIGKSFAYNTAVNHVNPAVIQHSYSNYTGAPHTAEAGPRIMEHQSLPRAVSPPAAPIVTRSRQTAPTPVQSSSPAVGSAGGRPAAVVKMPAAAPSKINRVAPTRAPPAKQ